MRSYKITLNLWAEIGKDGDGGLGKSVRGNGADPKTAAHHLSQTKLNSGHEIQRKHQEEWAEIRKKGRHAAAH